MGWRNGFLKFGRTRRREAVAQAGQNPTIFDPRVVTGRGTSVEALSGDRADPQIAEEIKLRQKQLMLHYVMTIRAR